jgi:hypothetical protein
MLVSQNLMSRNGLSAEMSYGGARESSSITRPANEKSVKGEAIMSFCT